MQLTQTLVPVNFTRAATAAARGLFDVLAGSKLRDCVIPTRVAGISFLPMRGKEPSRIGSLTSNQVRDFYAQAAREYDVVLIDTPSILEGLEATLICKETESLLLAVTPKTSDRDLKRASKLLRTAGTAIGGVLFNQAKSADLHTVTPETAEQLELFLPGRNASFLDALKSRGVGAPAPNAGASRAKKTAVCHGPFG